MNNSERSTPPPTSLQQSAQSRPSVDKFSLPPNLQSSVGATNSSYGVFAIRSPGACAPPPSLMRSVEFLSVASPHLKKFSPKPAMPLKMPPVLWKVPEGSINEVPAFFPIERTSTLVMNSKASKIASRISDCLRRRSIASSYGRVKAKAKCVTMDGVEFRIRLYAAKDEYTGGIIVEVQRRNGWSMSFHQDCNALLESAKTDKIGKDNANGMSAIPRTPLGVSMAVGEISEFSSLLELLSNGKVNVNVIGMEALCSLTDVIKMGIEVAVRNVNKVMQNTTVRKLLENFIKTGKIRAGFIQYYQNCLRDLSIRLLTNCTDVISQYGSLKEAISRDSWLENELIPLLFDELKQASERPNQAAYATKCLKNIVGASTIACSMVVKCGGYAELCKANAYGQLGHAFLSYESKQLQIMLRSSRLQHLTLSRTLHAKTA